MQQLCSNLGCDTGDDAFEGSTLLKEVFEFTWGVSRLASDPKVAVLSPTASPAMVMKVDFLQQPERLAEQMKGVLPDFLSPKPPRAVLPRARWKELWVSEPSSIMGLEQQLAKLVEQALWVMAAEPLPAACGTDATEASPSELQLEPWMTEHDDQVAKARGAEKKAKKPKKKKPQLTVLEPIEDTAQSDSEEEEDLELCAAVGGCTTEASDVENSLAEQVHAQLDLATSFEAESDQAGGVGIEGSSVVVQGSYLSLPLPIEQPALGVGEEYPMHMSPLHLPDALNEELPPCALRPPRTPPSSPLGASRTWQPPELVNYLWGQTSRLSASPGDGEACESHPCTPGGASGAISTRTPVTPMSLTSSAQGTPFHRGLWMPVQQQVPVPSTTRLVVRNTFIDVDVMRDAEKTPGQRSSRSLSPSFSPSSKPENAPTRTIPEVDLSGGSEQWQWYWH
jgi:hypothetical protein